ncbi:MAG: hypothetical protein IPK63_05335 [Candidatus Competibacteraceae bacterium]|nr:hypothetical protein [Candidatus Competibacteraceae bacterium]
MPKQRLCPTTLLSLSVAIAGAGWMSAWAADTSKPTSKPTESQSASAIASAKMELPFPNGEKWATATEREKLSYLLGIMNMAMAEYQLTGEAPKYRTLVPKMVQSLDGTTLRQMMAAVDAYYKANPDQQKRSIFEVIWFEIVVLKAGDKPQAVTPTVKEK